MRIMHVSTRLILGGSQENTVLSCMGQSDDGHEVSLVFGPIEGPEGTMLPAVEAHGGIQPIETPDLVRELSPRRDLRCRRELERLIRDWRPDVVHTHSSKAGILGRAAAWSAGVPAVVHTIHGLPFHPFLPWWRNQIYVRSERWAARRCHAIATVADAMRDQALAEDIGRPDQYRTIRSGMVIDPYLVEESRTEARRRLGLPQDAFIVGTIARLAELKGHDDLLDACGPLMHRDPRIQLLWVGDGWWSDRLKRRIREMGLEGRVHTPGLVPPETIPGWIRAMDVVAHPSYREGLPRAVVQGLLSERPVIAYDIDGAPEVCVPGETGMLVPTGDLEALGTAIERLRNNPRHGESLAAEGRRRCVEAFDHRVMVRELDDLYRRVLEGRELRP